MHTADFVAVDETLDPDDWAGAERIIRCAISDALRDLADLRARAVWHEMPPSVRRGFESPVPVDPTPLDDVLREVRDNIEIMLRLQECGIAVILDTTLNGQHSLRVAFCNHRTRIEDLDLLVDEVARIGDEILAEE